MDQKSLKMLQAYAEATAAGAEKVRQERKRNATESDNWSLHVLASAYEAIHRLMDRITWIKGEKGDKGDKGDSVAGPKGDRGESGQNGKDGRDGRDGKDAVGIQGPAGKDGQGTVLDYQEITTLAKAAVKKHEKDYNHKLIHDQKMLGEYELDAKTLNEGDILQVKGKKLVGIALPKAPKSQQQFVNAQQGVSNVRSFSVTASRELDAMGLYVVDASAGNITITVPTAAGRENYWFEIIRIDSTNNSVTLTPTGSETMSGMTTYSMQQWTDVQLYAYSGNYLLRNAS